MYRDETRFAIIGAEPSHTTPSHPQDIGNGPKTATRSRHFPQENCYYLFINIKFQNISAQSRKRVANFFHVGTASAAIASAAIARQPSGNTTWERQNR
jgi:phenylpropionate dioxygenase-like ring-hydroxylating dioxygenase large terminal subunit